MQAVLAAQLAGLALAAAGRLRAPIPGAALAYYYLLVTQATVVALVRYLRFGVPAVWDKAERHPVSRPLDVAGSAVLLALTSPLIGAAALAVKLEDGGPGAVPAGTGRPGRARVRALQAPDDGRRGGAHRRGVRGRRGGPADHARRPRAPATLDRRAPAALERPHRRDGSRRTATDARLPGRAVHAAPAASARGEAGDHRLGPGNGRAALHWDDRIELDVWYVEHRSLWLDLKILARTPFALFGGTYKGASGGWKPAS